MLLRAIHEAIQGLFKRAKPKTLIHQIGPLHLQLAFAAKNIRREGETLEFLVRLD